MNLYKWLWTKAGKRPWTFITRDLWQEAEYVFIVGFVTIGWFLGFYWLGIIEFFYRHPFALFGAGFGLFTIGYILGHIFWGTRYVPGQRGD